MDFAPTAIEQARSRAAVQGANVEFAVVDATELTGYDGRFDTVISCSLLHCLHPDQRRAHISALHRVTRPGGRLIQFCFPDTEQARLFAPHPIPERDLRAAFPESDWTIVALDQSRITTNLPPAPMLRALGLQDETPELDDSGAVLVPTLLLQARRT